MTSLHVLVCLINNPKPQNNSCRDLLFADVQTGLAYHLETLKQIVKSWIMQMKLQDSNNVYQWCEPDSC